MEVGSWEIEDGRWGRWKMGDGGTGKTRKARMLIGFYCVFGNVNGTSSIPSILPLPPIDSSILMRYVHAQGEREKGNENMGPGLRLNFGIVIRIGYFGGSSRRANNKPWVIDRSPNTNISHKLSLHKQRPGRDWFANRSRNID